MAWGKKKHAVETAEHAMEHGVGDRTTVTTTTHTEDATFAKHHKNTGLMGTVSSIIKLGSSIAIICLTAKHLDTSGGCFLAGSLIGSVCKYAYAVGAIGILLALLSAMTGCGPLARMGRASAAGQSGVHALNVIWWVTAAVVFSCYHAHAEANGVGLSSYRKGVVALSWICAILSWIMFALALMFACGGRSKAKKVVKTTTVEEHVV